MTDNRVMTDSRVAPFDHQSFLASLTQGPGIYQMFDEQGQLLYVGKAKNLRNRVSSYFRGSGLNSSLNNKTLALVSHISHIEVSLTRNETEALLLEQNLIKAHRPPYNIVLRDDKSYPYILISGHEYPRIVLHRGSKQAPGSYFGPYPSASDVRDSLSLLQKVFLLRPCEDSVFKNRSRPCLQHQIGRCSAPCVGNIPSDEYADAVRRARLFLEGKSQDLLTELGDAMDSAAGLLEFERAAALRDQIGSLQRVRETQYIEGEKGDLDILALHQEGSIVCVQAVHVRQGRILGSRSYQPRLKLDETPAEILRAFLGQFYLGNAGREVPREILVNVAPADGDALVDALAQRAGFRVQIVHRLRGARQRWLTLAADTARQNSLTTVANRQNAYNRLAALADELGLEAMPERLECFDISHSGGEKTVASCVVFGVEGPVKADYRRFNIDGISPGDDYAAMTQALQRRYQRLQREEAKLPDLLIIDGGKGQLGQARQVLKDEGIADVLLLGIAKGPTRKAGFERLYFGDDNREIVLAAHSPALHLLQQIRDEAHRFAITGHKGRRDQSRRQSSLEKIPGVGAKTRQKLLRYFGGLQGIRQAAVEDLAKVSGVSQKLAQAIHDALHPT
jgi:excinuclease ABC subunit C